VPNTYTKLTYHLVFCTKHRRKSIEPAWRDELYAYIGGIVRNEGGQLIAAGGMPDHVHLLVIASPTATVSQLLMKIKANSSHWVSANKAAFDWQEGYGAFTVSESRIPAIKKYITNQEEHHRKLSFQEEFAMLLERHGVEFDPRYLA
jgi:REP element-mobilizing transposase RayT